MSTNISHFVLRIFANPMTAGYCVPASPAMLLPAFPPPQPGPGELADMRQFINRYKLELERYRRNFAIVF